MSIQQGIIFGVLLLTLVLFVTGRWRYDVVALLALMIVALAGLIPAERVFSGFSNAAVITVAAVLVISRGLQNSGVVDLLGERLLRLRGGVTVQLAALTGIVAALSAFMNNIGRWRWSCRWPSRSRGGRRSRPRSFLCRWPLPRCSAA